MHHRKMSFLTLIGNPDYADADLLATDGQVIPFHKVIFTIIPKDRQDDIRMFKEYIESRFQNREVSLPDLPVHVYTADCPSIRRPPFVFPSILRLSGESSASSTMELIKMRKRT
jgi:hypothetical protein